MVSAESRLRSVDEALSRTRNYGLVKMNEPRNLFVSHGINPFTKEPVLYPNIGALVPNESADSSGGCRIALDDNSGDGSHFFGVPNRTGDWPVGPNGPLTSIVSIKLSDLPSGSLDFELTGWLNVFYDLDAVTGGYSPGCKASWHIEITPEDSPLAQPNQATASKEKRPIAFTSFNSDEKVSPSDTTSQLHSPCHSVGGRPHWIQGDARPAAHLSSGHVLRDEKLVSALRNAGIAPDALIAKDHKELLEMMQQLDGSTILPEQFHEGVADWTLLAQIDSDERLDFMWHDVGMLYILAPSSRLAKKDVSDAWIIMQCH